MSKSSLRFVQKCKSPVIRQHGFWHEVAHNKVAYLMALPGLLFYFIFLYLPMFGVIIAFQDYTPAAGFLKSSWVGLAHFKEFFGSIYFFRTLKNTILLSGMDLVIGFPAPIILALLLNEIRSKYFKKTVQTITYIPHFVSLVIICGMIKDFCMRDGVINLVLGFMGMERSNLLTNPGAFRWIYVLSGIWQNIGWSSIVYLAALGGIDSSLYEAAMIDGANKLRQTIHVTLPGLAPTIVVLFIMAIGNLMGIGYEKVLLLYNSAIYDTADIISTFVYRTGLKEMNFSYSTAVGLFNSVINLILLLSANTLSRKITDMSLW